MRCSTYRRCLPPPTARASMTRTVCHHSTSCRREIGRRCDREAAPCARAAHPLSSLCGVDAKTRSSWSSWEAAPAGASLPVGYGNRPSTSASIVCARSSRPAAARPQSLAWTGSRHRNPSCFFLMGCVLATEVSVGCLAPVSLCGAVAAAAAATAADRWFGCRAGMPQRRASRCERDVAKRASARSTTRRIGQKPTAPSASRQVALTIPSKKARPNIVVLV